MGAFDAVAKDAAAFFRDGIGTVQLRPYQTEAALAVAGSIKARDGAQFAIVFARQAGKDEMLAQLLAWLLVSNAETGGSAVIAAPTMRPQAAISRDRLLLRLRTLLGGEVRLREGYIVEVGLASARFLSADPVANARGQTADLLLVANEAQDIAADIWDPVFDPMAATTNATTLFLGTPWTRDTLLARQMRHIRLQDAEDGTKRLFLVPWTEVARHIPGYGQRVEARIAQFGPRHPFVRTEYELEEIDGEERFFSPERLARMAGDHPREKAAVAGKRYALLIDVAGADEAGGDLLTRASQSRRDSTALTVVWIDGDGPAPVYRVVDRMVWTGVPHTDLHDEIVRLARETWRAEIVVIDGTGMGTGLASFLKKSLGERTRGRAIPVRPFIFTARSKSTLGWNFLGLVDTGRFKEYVDDERVSAADRLVTERYRAEQAAIVSTSNDGPGKLLQWGAPPGRGHDDLVVSAVLTADLEQVRFRRRVARGHPGFTG